MPNIFHQTIEDILRAASPAQKILWNEIFLRFGDRVAASQLVLIGAVGTPEITVYTARKIYLAYELSVSKDTPAGAAATQQVFLYNENNAQQMVYANSSVYWDATAAAARYAPNRIDINNIWFSRIASAGAYNYVKFIGYRITY
jgi:hypothetical protein